MSMEHEQINDKNVALVIRGTKLTAHMLAQAMKAFVAIAQKQKIKHGSQSLKSLAKQGTSLADIEISGNNIGTFKKTARKFNIDFSLKKDDSVSPPKWVVYFKAKDDKAMQCAFNEYAKITLKQQTRKTSMLAKLQNFKDIALSAPQRVLEKVKDMLR